MNSFFYFRRILVLLLIFSMKGNSLKASDFLPRDESERLSLEQQLFVFKGTVRDTGGKPVVGATVTIVERKSRTMTDQNGHFTIRSVPTGSYTVNIAHVSYEDRVFKEYVINEKSIENFVIVLEETSEQIEDVIVTALGVKRDERSLGYSTTTIDGKEISETAPSNWLNALSGKVPGLNITQGNAGPGGTVRVTLRGQNSLDLDKGEPLLVIDGIPVTSGMIGNNGQSYGASANQDSPIDYGNGASEINPEDIESVTVLHGPSAAALYGSRAGSGAILITTKSQSEKKDRLAVSFSSALTFDQVLKYPDFQMEYGDGGVGKDKYYSFANSEDGPATHSGGTWGPRFDNQEYFQYDPNTQTMGTVRTPWVPYENYIKEAFRTGVTYNNTLSLSGGNANNLVRFSYNDRRNRYILDNTGNFMNRLSFSSTSKLNKFNFNTRLNYYYKGSDNLPLSGYNANTFMYSLMYAHPNIPYHWHENYWRPGQEDIAQNNRLLTTVDNPYFMLNEQINTLANSRLFGNINASYDFTEKMSLQLRGGIDQSESFRTLRKPFSSMRFAEGRYQEQNIKSLERNFDFLFKYDEKLGSLFNMNFIAGGNHLLQESQNNVITAERLSYPGLYTIANSKDRPLSNINRYKKIVNSLYGTAGASYKNIAFVDFSGRNDWSSALPVANNSYFYGSASASLIVTDLFYNVNWKYLDYLKLRGAISEVGNDTNPYQTQFYYSNSPFGGSYNSPVTLPGLDLMPERIINKEIGIETRFFSNRFSLDATYYHTDSKNQILQVPNDPSTGYQFRVFNAGLITNKGFEVSLKTEVLNSKNWNWKSTLNWSRNRSQVVELASGVESVILATGPRGFVEARVGGRVGDIYGNGYLRNENGEIVFDTNGLPMLDTDNMIYVGNSAPKWKAGFQNQLTYKWMTFNLLFDGQYGGSVYSYTHSILAGSGKLKSTLPGRETGVIGKGVQKNDDGTYRQNDIIANAAEFYVAMYGRENVEENTFDVSYLKLREVSFTATLPVEKIFRNNYIKRVNVGLYGRDLLLFTKFPLWDPEIGTMNRNRIEPGFETAQFPSTRSFGINVSFLF